jgi:predicted Fe-S protein YdhL (DUF1289 family)
MNSKNEILQSEDWWSGVNKDADEALNLALNALQARDSMRCFACLRAAMVRYGWEFHSDSKARRLWDKCEKISKKLSGPASACDTRDAAAITALYHETYRAVHFDRNRRIRRHLPPRDPAARIEAVVPLAGDSIT